MKVENPEILRNNVSNMFKTQFNIDNESLCKNIEISIFNYTLRKLHYICFISFKLNIIFKET